MTKLILEQPQTLLELVGFANRHAGVLPTARELGDMFEISERAASSRMKRITESQRHCFIKERDKSRITRINYDRLCTEKDTAHLLLTIYDKCLNSSTGRIAISDTYGCVEHNEAQIKVLIDYGIKTGYLQSIPANPQEIRAGHELFNHFEYLKLLVET